MVEGSTQPPQATRFIETTRGILSYEQLAPFLGERVLRVLEDIEEAAFSATPLTEELLCELHAAICGDLTPDWAGRFRRVEVKVGEHQPPAAHQIPILLRDYFADLNARFQAVISQDNELLLEFLAFAEGRLLSIHPFADFNGRATRLFIAELLRRLDLPLVELAPETDVSRQAYLDALRAADRQNWKPLADFWRQRLEAD
jgi:CRISPR-associated endonuclease/helicase Cas3